MHAAAFVEILLHHLSFENHCFIKGNFLLSADSGLRVCHSHVRRSAETRALSLFGRCASCQVIWGFEKVVAQNGKATFHKNECNHAFG